MFGSFGYIINQILKRIIFFINIREKIIFVLLYFTIRKLIIIFVELIY